MVFSFSFIKTIKFKVTEATRFLHLQNNHFSPLPLCSCKLRRRTYSPRVHLQTFLPYFVLMVYHHTLQTAKEPYSLLLSNHQPLLFLITIPSPEPSQGTAVDVVTFLEQLPTSGSYICVYNTSMISEK